MRISDWSSDVCSSDLYFIDTLRRLTALGSPSLHPATKGWAASYPGAELSLFGFGAGTVGAPPPGRVHRLASGQTLGIKPPIMGVSCSLEQSRTQEHTPYIHALMRKSSAVFGWQKQTT